MSFNNIYDKKKLQQEANRADPNFGDGSFLLRPEDTSIQGASEDFMQYLQNPTQEMMPPAPVGNPAAIEDFDAMLEQDTLDKSLKAPVSAPQNITTSMKGSVSGSSKGGSTSSDTPPASTPQDDILAQLKAARDANAIALAGAKESDDMTAMKNRIRAAGSEMSEGFANRGGYTDIKLKTRQDEAKEMDRAGASGKSKLESLLQDYGLRKGMDDTAYNRQKDADARQDKLNERAENLKLKREEMDYKKINDAQAKTLAKEEVKEGIQISKENRKIRKEMDDAIPALEAQLANVKEAKAMLTDNKETGVSGVATGPVDQYYSKFTKEGQTLEKKLNKISLDTMVKMFSGMSKAVDTNAERAQFQSTQPQMRDYQSVNINTLQKLEDSINSMINKTNIARNKYDRTGDFTQPEEKAPQQSKVVNQSTGPYGDTVDRNGKTWKWNASAGKYQPIQ